MAFLGAPVFTAPGARTVSIAGLSLAAGQTGTIGDNGDAGADEQLPASQSSGSFPCPVQPPLTHPESPLLR